MTEPEAQDSKLWHHRVHQRWGGEDLSFWRLAFFPQYDPKEIIPLLKGVMDELGISSYAIYETFGLYDLFVRAWVPRQTMERLDATLTHALAAESMQLCEAFTVSRVLRHWAWDDGQGGMYEPDPDTLARPWSLQQITNADSLTPDGLKRVDKDRHIVRGLTQEPGVKFIIVITASVYAPTLGARKRLAEGLIEILDEQSIPEPSLYEGSGFGQFIVMGRVVAAEFFKLPALVQAINSTGIRDTARPYTFVSAREGLVAYVDKLPRADVPIDQPDAEGLLAQGEGQRVEVKASARLSWRRFLLGDGEKVTEDKIMNEGLIKAVVGLLNTDGGNVVLGALEERSQFREYLAGNHPMLKQFPRRNGFVLVGVNDEYDERGWDKYRLRLLDTINSRIEPPPAGSIGLRRQEVEGRDLCIVSVRPTSATWHYQYVGNDSGMRFFVREDGRTIALDGSAADAYKRAHPRG